MDEISNCSVPTRFWHYQYSYFSHSTRYIEVSHQGFNLHFPSANDEVSFQIYFLSCLFTVEFCKLFIYS